MMTSFNLTLSGKHFLCPSILNDSFAGQSNLGCRSLSFMSENTSFQPLLTCKVSFENQLIVLWELPCGTFFFSLAAFKTLSLSLILGNLIIMCLGVFLLGSYIFGILWASWTSWKYISFARLGVFIFIIFSNKFSISYSSCSPSGTPMIWILEHLKLSWRFLSLSSFFFFELLFLYAVLVECLFLLSGSNCWFESRFPSLHCWFPV